MRASGALRRRCRLQIYGDRLRFGVHSGQQYATVQECFELWRRAEALGYDWVSNFDHFRPPQGGPSGPCFEGPTLLAALAARSKRVRCGMLVLGVSYRHPAIVASIAATIDHVCEGRLELGLGATSDDLGHDQFGLSFPPVGIRMEMLDEACRVIRSLWTRETTTFEGRHYRLTEAHLEPKPIQDHLPLVIGGAGERRMLRIVAEHADIWNTTADDPETYRRRLAVLDRYCHDVGRDPAGIRKSILFRAVLAETESEASRRASIDSTARSGFLVVGTPEQCAERLRPYLALGVRDLILGVRPPVDWTTIDLVAEQLAPRLRATAPALS